MSNIVADSALIAMDVKSHTGNAIDAAYAGGANTWVQSITGQPMSLSIEGDVAYLRLNEAQIKQMQSWLDQTIIRPPTSTRNSAGKTYHIELGPVFKPWAMKYAIPVLAIALITGIGIGKFVLK